MTFIKLTKMIERKTKDAEVGEYIHLSFKVYGSVWILGQNIAAMSEVPAQLERDDGTYEPQSLTEILLSGQPEPLYVSERAQEIVDLIGK